MALSNWVIAIVVLLGLIQLVFYYLLRRKQRSVSKLREETFFSNSELDEVDSELVETGNGRRCQTCGAVNDMAYTFCRECAARLGSA